MTSSRRFSVLFLAVGALALAAISHPTALAAQRRGGGSGQADSSQRDPLASAVGALKLRSIGPSVISGRIIDLAVAPNDKSTWYVATASGGLWKTTNAGTNFSPIFDGEGSYSIGTVMLDPNNSNVVWVGTGENNAQRSIAYGDGIYKSEDAGRSWHKMGLDSTEHIGKIVIDPRNSDVIYVAAHGPLFRGGGQRGLYKTADGGKTWTNVLNGGEWAGVADVVMDPRNPDILIASVWQRARRQWGYIAGGPQSSLQRSTDGGASWTKVRGMPSGDLGRIGLAYAPSNPDIIYAVVEAPGTRGGFYRSENNGVTWQRMSGEWTTGNYYNEVFVDPLDADRIYLVDTRNMISEDGGKTFAPLGERNKHVDNHVVWIDPEDTNHLLLGCDGGLYESFDRGQNYVFFSNLPLGQFYRVETDNSTPFFRVFGGTQDNSSVGGPSRTRTRLGGTSGDWFLTQGGDGFVTRVDPQDPNIVYAEYQNGGLSRFNLATGEDISIVPAEERGEPGLRWHWDAPLIISPFSHTRVYFGANRLYRSDDRGDTWRAVSPDLTRQIDRNRLKMMGRVWGVDAVGKNSSTSLWGAIVSVAESPLKEGLIWAGTDDGLIQVTTDGGQTWRRIESVSGVPDTTFIATLTPSAFDTNTVYATFDNHKAGDNHPYVAKSTDLGRRWTVITNNLPERGTAYTIVEDVKNPNLLFVGTEFGLYFSANGGQKWTQLKNGLPTIPVRDITIQQRDDALVLASFGRGFYVLDNLSSLRALTPALLANDATLLPVPRTPMYVESSPDPNWQGGRFWTGDNPPFGAVFSYYLKDAIRTMKQQRERAEQAAERRGSDVFYPSWDSLKAEAEEEAPEIILTVTDPEGRVVRRLTGPVSAGLHQVTWNLRYPSASPVTSPRAGGGGGGGGFFFGGGSGPWIVPGTYTVSLSKSVDGVVTTVGSQQTFEVYMLDGPATPRSPAVLAFQRQAQSLQRAVLGANGAAGEAMNRIQLLKRALDETPSREAMTVARSVRVLEDSLRDVQEALAGDRTAARHNESTPPSLMQRLGDISPGAWSSSMGDATATQKRQYEIIAGEFGAILERLRRLVEVNLKQVEDAAEAAGAPWTSGRIPNWRP